VPRNMPICDEASFKSITIEFSMASDLVEAAFSQIGLKGDERSLHGDNKRRRGSAWSELNLNSGVNFSPYLTPHMCSYWQIKCLQILRKQ
jgi:hypothetical protein